MKKVLIICSLVAVLIPCLVCPAFAFYPGFIGDNSSMYTEAVGSRLQALVLKGAQLSNGQDRADVVIPLSEFVSTGHSDLSFNTEGYQLDLSLYASENDSGSRYIVDIVDSGNAYTSLPSVSAVSVLGTDFTASCSASSVQQLYNYCLTDEFLPYAVALTSSSSAIGTAFPSRLTANLKVIAHSTSGDVVLGSTLVEVNDDRSNSTVNHLIPDFKSLVAERFASIQSQNETNAQFFTLQLTNIEISCYTLLSSGYFTPDLIRLSVDKLGNYTLPEGVYLGKSVLPNIVEVINPLESLFATAQTFLELEILPGVTFGGFFAVLVCVPTVVALLKLFAGG